MGTQGIVFKEKKSIPQEQTPSTFKSGEEMPITRVNGFYKAEGVEGVFTSRAYAEQAYREYLRSKTIPVMEKELRQAKKRAKLGFNHNDQVKQIEEKNKEWLETH